MTSPKEVEIKLELAPTSLSRLKKIPLIHRPRAVPKRATEVSVYFDTPKRKLHKKGLLLRVRRIGDRYIQTIKASFEFAFVRARRMGSQARRRRAGPGSRRRYRARAAGKRKTPAAAQAAVRDARAPDDVPGRQQRAGNRIDARSGHDPDRNSLGAALRDRARASARADVGSVRRRARAHSRASGATRAREQIGARL